VACVAFQSFSRRRAYKDKTINCEFCVSVLFTLIKRKIEVQLGFWLRDVFLHLSKATQNAILLIRKVKTAVFNFSLSSAAPSVLDQMNGS
jgi:hypothetical protein